MNNHRRRYYRYQRKPRLVNGRKILAKVSVVLAGLLAVGGLCLMGYKGLSQSDFFQIADIEIEGCNRLSKEAVLELSGVDIHSNLVGLDREELRERLESHAWIKNVTLDTEWSGRLTIRIEERAPVALINVNGYLYYIDRSADVFAALNTGDETDFPLVSGHIGEDEQAEELALKEALLLLKYAEKNKRSSLPLQNISEINISKDDLVVFLTDRPFPIHLGRDRIYEKYNRLSKVLYWLYKRKEFSRVAYIHVDYTADKVLVGRGTG